MNLNDIYKQLTSIDIEQQKLLWDERGKGYYGEYLVFCKLYKNIPGIFKILMNLNIPTKNDKTTEIDLVLIHGTGIYVFEIKHYKGTIYGDDNGAIWTQYFKTTKNNTFKNPMLQNAYHIDALKNILGDIPIKSVIVFTNEDCNIKVKNSNPNISLSSIHNLSNILEQSFRNSEFILSIEEIDNVFNKLTKYSQMQEIVLYDGKEESFVSWLQPILQNLKEEKEYLNYQIIQNKKHTNKVILINSIIVITCILLIFISVSFIKSKHDRQLEIIKQNYNNKLEIATKNYYTELEKMRQNFKHVDEINNEYIKVLNEYFLVSDVSIKELTSNSVTFTAKISKANTVYGMALTEDSKYIVITSNNKVYEYNVFGKHLKYNKFAYMIGERIRDYGNLAQSQFHGVSKDEIDYIKITNIKLFKLDMTQTTIKENLELELYSK